jgi:hypothetical protein
VLKVIDAAVTPLQTLASGDVFGEMAVLTESPRTATVLALEDTTVYVVEGDVLRREMDAMKPWMAMLLKRLAQRFTDIYRSRRVTSTFMPSLPAPRVANQLLMTLRTWGTTKDDGTLTAKWSKIASDMEAQQGAPPMSMGVVAKKYGEHVRVDIDEDLVEIRDPDGLRQKLSLDLTTTYASSDSTSFHRSSRSSVRPSQSGNETIPVVAATASTHLPFKSCKASNERASGSTRTYRRTPNAA